MCLSTLENFKVHKYYGWQVFNAVYDEKDRVVLIYPLFFGVAQIPTNVWTKDKSPTRISFFDISSGLSRSYLTGHHIFLRKKDAEAYMAEGKGQVVRKVRFKKVVAKGTQAAGRVFAKVVVARERYVEE